MDEFYDTQLERDLVYMLATEPRYRARIMNEFNPEAFSAPMYRKIWDACVDIEGGSQRRSWALSELEAEDKRKNLNLDIVEMLCSADKYYSGPDMILNTLRELHLKRLAHAELTHAIKSLSKHEIEQVISDAQERLFSIQNNGLVDNNGLSFSELGTEALCRYRLQETQRGYSWGIARLNKWTGGIHSGRLYIVAGTKKSGKSRLVLVMSLGNVRVSLMTSTSDSFSFLSSPGLAPILYAQSAIGLKLAVRCP